MKYRSYKITESQINRVINETLSELLHKKKGNNILGYENDNADETIPNGVNLGIAAINESKGNNIELSLEIGYNFHVNDRSSERIDDWVLFEVVCRDTSNNFVETIASYTCKTPEDFNKPTFDVMVHTSNFWDNTEEIISELGGGKRRDFSYEDEPEQVFKRSKCNIKPFVMEHMKEGLNAFKNDTYYPDWQKKRAYAILSKCGVINKEPLKEKVDDTIFQVNILRSGEDDERAFVTPYDGKHQGIINGTKWCVYTGTREECVQWADNYNNKHNYKCLQERTASEEGMTDDEVRKKRTLDFINGTNWERNIHDNPADDDLFLAGKDRYRKHLDTQKGSRFAKKAEKAYKTGKI